MEVKLFADNDHLNLQAEINAWLKRDAPDVVRWMFVADGAEFTYCVLVVHQ